MAFCLALLLAPAGYGAGPSAPPRKSPTAKVGQAPKKGNIALPGKVLVPSPVADVGAAPVRGKTALPGKIPTISLRKEGCKQRLSVGSDALFDFDKYDLTPSAEQTLNELGPMVLKYGSAPHHSRRTY